MGKGLGAILPLQPGQLPSVSLDPQYANPQYAGSLQDTVVQVAANKNAARATAEADAQTKKIEGLLLGAVLAYVVVKYVL